MRLSHDMLLRCAGVLNFVNGTCDAIVNVGPLTESQVAPLVRCFAPPSDARLPASPAVLSQLTAACTTSQACASCFCLSCAWAGPLQGAPCSLNSSYHKEQGSAWRCCF